MGNTKNFRHYFWDGQDFVTYCLFFSGKLVSFQCTYLLRTHEGYIIKERLWENGGVARSFVYARCPTRYPAAFVFAALKTSLNQSLYRNMHIGSGSGPLDCFPVKSRSPMRPHAPVKGEQVTCLRPIQAYYSGYAGNPICYFEPGDVGVIGAVDVPAVYHTPENPCDLFACVDFEKKEAPQSGNNGAMWRCHMYYHQMIPLDQYGAHGDNGGLSFWNRAQHRDKEERTRR